jgi:hypothetical protein
MRNGRLQGEGSTMRVALVILGLALLTVVPVLLFVGFCGLLGFSFDFHTTPRLNPFDGTILDERTHVPLANAKVVLTAHPEVSCKSDSSGQFHFKEIDNWHYGRRGNAGLSDDVPSGEQWGWDITVSQTNYVQQEVSLFAYSDHVILLKKVGEPSESHPWLVFNCSGDILKDMGAAKYLKPGDIRILGHLNGKLDAEPTRIHIGFSQRVYGLQIRPLIFLDGARIVDSELKGLDWEFVIEYDHGVFDPNLKDSDRLYRLEFSP